MTQFFTDRGNMVGQRPRQKYFEELQDAIVVLQEQYTNLAEGPVKQVYKEATEPIYRYPFGTSTFKVEEAVNTGYPTMDGIVETVYVSDYRNLQFFYTQSADEKSGETYTRQWKEEFRQWSPWEKHLMQRDMVEHIEDKTAHITEHDRYRLQGYVHEQLPPETTWNIQHHLEKFPSVTIVDSGGNVVIGDIRYVSENEVQLTFSAAFSGKAYLS